MRKVSVFICLFGLTLAGCDTSYREQSFRNGLGVSAEPITSTIYRIHAYGNGFDDKTKMSDFALLKAAETAKEHGASYFVVMNSNDLSYNTFAAMPGVANTTIVGNSMQTIYSPGPVVAAEIPRVELMIELKSVAPGAAPPAGAISVDEIIKSVGPRVKKPKRS